MVASTAITINKREKDKSIEKKHDKRGLHLGYGLPPEHLYGAPEPAPIYETHVHDAVHGVGPPLPPPAIAHPAR